MVEKGFKDSTSRVESQGELILTNSEKDVLVMLTEDFLTIKQIALKRNTSVQAVHKIAKKLKKKGAYDQGFNRVENVRTTFKPTPHQIRLHGQEFNIQILFKDQRYKGILTKSNLINIDGNSIRLYQDSIEVYSGQSFYADDCQKATARSMAYFDRLFNRLEHDLKVIIKKPRSQNIRLVNQHYAETNNELSKECELRGEKIRVYGNDDGKLWFTLDNSLNLHESETQNPKTAKHDMENVVKPFFNDLRTNEAVTMTDIKVAILELARENKETASGLNSVVTLMKGQEERPLDDGNSNKLQDYFG